MAMFDEKDIRQFKEKGTDLDRVEAQIERFRTGFPWMKIVSPATAGRGISVMTQDEIDEAVKYCDNAEVSGRAKFVPASGAASRMFKALFADLSKLEAGESLPEDSTGMRFSADIKDFAFYNAEDFSGCSTPLDYISHTLLEPGLGYGSKPKAVLKFHRYDDEVRTALAEHFVEAAEYMRNAGGSAKIVITISPEHKELFEKEIAEIKPKYEERFGIRYDVSLVYQDKSTDTVAVTADNQPFRLDDGTVLFRPGGHGALIHNLNRVEEELVSIKNIDNVCVQRLHPVTAMWKKVLMGKALELRDRIFGYLRDLDAVTGKNVADSLPPFIPSFSNERYEQGYMSEECQLLCNEIETFLEEELCVTVPCNGDCKDRVEAIREKLNRPIRVCGVVRNQGEPGGGPFIVEDSDGSTSLQILESVQINPDDVHAMDALSHATHFNPVDIVCLLKDYKGNRFNLLDYVDDNAGFISSKSYQGRELKALELPGLWNGAMSDWNTLFVEVPLETFNPVKTVMDLLRPAHQA